MPADCLGMGIRRWDRKIGVTRSQTEPSHEIALDKPLLHPTHPLLPNNLIPPTPPAPSDPRQFPYSRPLKISMGGKWVPIRFL
jgi:hypothetical protein